VVDEHRERELKFDVPETWRAPDLDAALPPGSRVETATVHLESTYFDTAERDLLRSRVTLRRRRGDTDTGWHLKVPAGNARLELRHALGPDDDEDVPGELADLTLGLRAGASLAPIATLVTERAVRRVVDETGRTMAEVVVDEVRGTALAATVGEAAVLTQWREVEVELGETGDERLLERLAAHLRTSGAEPAASASKIARALGRPPVAARRPDGLAGIVADYLDAQFLVLVGQDVELRRGRDAVHGTRTATRRYRSALRIFAPLMDADRAAHLDAELKWYAEVLGRLRDRHVLRAHLDAAVDELPPELVLGPVRNRIHHLLDADLAEAQAALDETMTGERYFALLRELRAWYEHPPLAEGRPAADANRFLRKAERRLRRRLAAAGDRSSPEHDAAMHRARKAAKRLRYTAELAEPELGRAARKTRKRAKRVQERLGARQDSVIAAEFLLRAGRVAGTTPDENGFTFGLLYQRERDAVEGAG